MKIVYTTSHGAGEMLARRALAQQDWLCSKLLKHKQLLTQTLSCKISKPKLRLAEELGRQVGADVLGNWLTLTVLVLKFFKKMVATLTFQVTKSGAIMASSILDSQKCQTLPWKCSPPTKSIVSTGKPWCWKLQRNHVQRLTVSIYHEKSKNLRRKHNHTYTDAVWKLVLIKPFVRW